MLGFLQTIVYWLTGVSDWIYNLVTYVVDSVGYIGDFAFDVWKLCFNIVPLPLQIIGSICGGVMIVRLVISLGRR